MAEADTATLYRMDMPRLRARCWWVVFGSVVTSLLFSLVGGVQLAMLYEVDVPIDWAWQAWLTGEEFFIIVSAAWLATVIVWLTWLFRAVANLKAVAAPAMTWSPRAAVIWNLIPLVSLVMGFFIMRAIWQGSTSRADAAPPLVTAWALSAIAPAVAALIPAFMAGDLAAYDVRYEALANLLQTLACALQALLALQITRAQANVRTIASTFA